MSQVLIFAGTVEGRTIADDLIDGGVSVHVCVATEYGEKLLPKGDGVTISSTRLDTEGMKALIQDKKPQLVVDATHPYAVLVSQNIKEACSASDTEYLRMVRDSQEGQGEHCIYVKDIQEAVEVLKKTEGNVLLTTGSKELGRYTEIPNYKTRLYARVLSTPEVAASCADLGFEGRNLICMQGPFSESFNYEMLRQMDARYLVTKESGKAGGFIEKLSAAARAGVTAIVIGRPVKETGVSYEACIGLLKQRFDIKVRKKVTLLGIGMGSSGSMTAEGMKACEQADVIIGAKRMTQSLLRFGKPIYPSYKPEEIKAYISEHACERYLIALSGDTGFFSGAAKLITALKDHDVTVLPGISSPVYLSSKLGITWQDMKFVSNHGRKDNLIGAVKAHEKVFSLLDGEDCVSTLCCSLIEYGLGHVKVHVGQHLSYEDEAFIEGTPEQLKDCRVNAPAVMLVINDEAPYSVITHGMADEAFIRGKVPMTKEEIRSISISKLRLTRKSVIYDIGAGTGSIAIEMALQADEGMVYAVEQKDQAVALISENSLRLGAANLKVCHGLAPEALLALPVPTHAFIGGSSGHMEEIMKLLLEKNPRIRMVINAITLETVAESMNCIKSLAVEDVDVAQVSVSKAETIGHYHMMKGQNPVYIISCTGNPDANMNRSAL